MATKLGSLTLDLICRTGNFTQGMRDASSAANRELGRIEQSTNGATNAIKGLAVAALGSFSVHQVIAYTDSYTNLQNRLKLVTNSQQELSTATKDTFNIAQATAQSWGSVAQVYQRFAENSSRLGITMQQTASLTDTVSKAISISGASAASAEAALMQFGQALASGVLRGEEFNSIAEQAPALLKAIATGLGVNIGELRKMAGEGQLTGDVVIKALNKAKTSVDDLFSKTDFTIAQSFTQLNDSVTKFVGEAGQGSGAAKSLASSIKMVADNVDTIADVAMVGGFAFLTKTVLNHTIAMKESIAVSIQRRLADTAALESQVRLSMVEVQRTRAKVGELAAEQNLIVAKLRTNISTQERIILETRATQVAIQLAVAERNLATATTQRTVAQNTLNASTAIGSRMMGVVGGPIGLLTIGVGALAAGYLYMQNQTAKATEKLAEQTDVANKTKEELLALQGVQKNGAKSELQEAFKGQNKELKELNYVFNAHLIEPQNAYRGNLQIVEISNKVRQGIMSQEQAIESLNQLDFISPDQLKQLQRDNELYSEKLPVVNKVQEALKVFGITTELAGNKSSNAAFMHDKQASSLDNVASAASNAKSKLQEYIKSLNDQNYSNNLTIGYLNQGYSAEQAQALSKAWSEAFATSSIVTKEQQDLILKSVDLEKQKSDLISERSKKEKESTIEAEKKFKYTQSELLMLQKIANLSAKADLDGISAKYGIPKNYLAGLMAQESKGDPNAVSPTGAIGYFQTTSGYRKDNGISVADSKNLPVIADVVARNLAKAYKELGSWESAIRSHNAGVGGSRQFDKTGRVDGSSERNKEVANFASSVNKWIVGLGGSGLKAKGTSDTMGDLKDYLDFVKQQAESRKSLELNVANEVTKIRESLKDKLIEIDKAGFTPERTAEIKAEYQSRADNEIAIAEYTLKTKLEEYSSFKKTDEQLLKDSFDQKKFYASRDIELSREQRTQAVALIDKQYNYELSKSKLVREQQLLQSKEFYMSELQLAKAKYDIERRLLEQSNDDPADKAFKSQMLALQNHVDMNRRLKDASTGWDTVQAQMNGSTGRYQVNQDKFSRMGASQNLFDTQIADVENQEQEPGADLQKLAEVREQIWAAHNQRMIDIENQYQTDSLNLQLTQAQQLTGSFANMFKGILGESSGAYKTMFAMQQGFAIAQAGMNLYSSASKAYNESLSPTVWGRMADAAKAMLDQGTFLAMIQAVTPQGFATGGHITGKGTGTSDDIPIMASNGEFMMKASAVSKLGLSALNYMNLTGQIPEHSNYMSMKSPSTKSDLSIQKFKDGGEIGVPRLNYTDVDSRRFNSIPKNSSQGEGGGDIKIEVNITDSGVNTSGGNTQNQKQLGDAIGNAVRAVIMKEKRQGGLLSK
ncbi:tape measure protein [Acinetobacter guillouiae]|uniref:tape measure protein n=2 Tax=Acinetobacter TaxID=469 RepID=UPI0022E56440|nr:tape measure protein [Acinetobacter guillouiae]